MGVYSINHLQNFQPAADGVTEVILETLPLRGLCLSIRASTTAANTQPNIANLASMVTNVEVLLGGAQLWATSLADAMNLQGAIIGRPPWYLGNGNVDNDLTALSVYIPFGRFWGSGPWAIPATPAGQLRLRLTCDIAVTGLDTLSIDVDGIYDDGIPNQAITGHLRTTTLQATATATGDLNVDLPVGRWLSGLGYFQTTFRSTQAGANGINRIKILRDGVEIRYPSIEMQNARLLANLSGADLGLAMQHVHVSDVAAAYTQFQDTYRAEPSLLTSWNNLWTDFDPAMDGTGLLDLRACNRLQARLNMGTAESVRILAVEWWPNTAAGNLSLPSGMA